jgi:two-component system LytT family response regulator
LSRIKVNIKEVARYVKTDGGAIEMSNGRQLPISRQKKEEVMRLLNGPGR